MTHTVHRELKLHSIMLSIDTAAMFLCVFPFFSRERGHFLSVCLGKIFPLFFEEIALHGSLTSVRAMQALRVGVPRHTSRRLFSFLESVVTGAQPQSPLIGTDCVFFSPILYQNAKKIRLRKHERATTTRDASRTPGV